jgi:asparagine synthetase B (glutamine-hydrolysing)
MGSLSLVISSSVSPGEGVVERMLAAAPHRGAPEKPLSIGHGRCGITSTGERDHASVATDHGLLAAFVGILDNAAELATELGLTAQDPTPSAARIYLEAFRRWGDAAPTHLRGPFAVVVTDGETVRATRDPFGLRCLFYRRDPRGIFVATELKQVLAGCDRPLTPDLDVVDAIVFGEYDDDTPTAIVGGERVPRGMTVKLRGTSAARHRYWDPWDILETGRYAAAELPERFDELMGRAASRALSGDDVISLSGGTDSSAIASYAAPAHRERFGRPLAALSVVYPRFPAVDEREEIELVADHLGIELHTYEESSKTLDEVSRWMAVLDEPVPFFFLAESAEHLRHAHSMGYRNMLTGELAEWVVERRSYLVTHLLLAGRFGAALDHLQRQRRRHGTSYKGMARQVGAVFLTPRMRMLWARVRPAVVPVPEWVDESRLRRVEGRWATRARDMWRGYQTAIFSGPDHAAEAEDVVEAVTGVTVRRPFADLDLVEFFLSLPAEQKFPDTHFKGLLRSFLRGRLPDAMLDQPRKAVFNDAVMARADYARLREFLIDPPHRLRGINYELLRDRLEAADLEIGEYERAKNLAAVHAYLARW